MVSGGDAGSGLAEQDSSEVWQTGAFESGPDLPARLRSHCLLKVDSDTLLLVGGLDGADARSNRAFTFSLIAQEWTEIAPMRLSRDSHTCQVRRRIFIRRYILLLL